MKKLIALLLVLMMVFAMAACGGKKDDAAKDGKQTAAEGGEATAESAADDYGIDLEAEGEQKMSDERASMDVLVETRDVWLEGKMSFALEENAKTYEDLVEHIGCDASTYTFLPEDGERHYTWIAEGDETAQFLAVFWETPQGWTLYTVGSVNIG